MEKTWQCRSRRQLLRVLYGENHPAARRRGHAPLNFEGRSRVGVFGSANAATSAFIPLPPLWTMCAIIKLYPNEIMHFKERVERCGVHRIPQLAPASDTSFFVFFNLFSLSFLFLSFASVVFLFLFFSWLGVFAFAL